MDFVPFPCGAEVWGQADGLTSGTGGGAGGGVQQKETSPGSSGHSAQTDDTFQGG